MQSNILASAATGRLANYTTPSIPAALVGADYGELGPSNLLRSRPKSEPVQENKKATGMVWCVGVSEMGTPPLAARPQCPSGPPGLVHKEAIAIIPNI